MTPQQISSKTARRLAKFWTRAELAEALGVCELTIARWCEAGTFPQPIRLGKRLLRWRDDEVQLFFKTQS